MNTQVFYIDRAIPVSITDVRLFNICSINEHNHARAAAFRVIAMVDNEGGIFTLTYPQIPWVNNNGVRQSTKPATFNKMCIDYTVAE